MDSDQKENYNFKQLEAYTFNFDNKDRFDPDSLIGQRIIKHFNESMSKLGHHHTNNISEADYIVRFDYYRKTYLSTPSTSVGVGVGRSSNISFGGVSVGRTLPTRRQIQGLKIQMIDPQTKNEIWNGEARGQIKFNTTEKTNEKIKTAILLIIEKFKKDLN